MPLKQLPPNKQHPVLVMLIIFTVFVSLFAFYEITVIKNPFFDPIAPYFLWICMVILGIGFTIKIVKALQK